VHQVSCARPVVLPVIQFPGLYGKGCGLDIFKVRLMTQGRYDVTPSSDLISRSSALVDSMSVVFLGAMSSYFQVTRQQTCNEIVESCMIDVTSHSSRIVTVINRCQEGHHRRSVYCRPSRGHSGCFTGIVNRLVMSMGILVLVLFRMGTKRER